MDKQEKSTNPILSCKVPIIPERAEISHELEKKCPPEMFSALSESHVKKMRSGKHAATLAHTGAHGSPLSLRGVDGVMMLWVPLSLSLSLDAHERQCVSLTRSLLLAQKEWRETQHSEYNKPITLSAVLKKA